MAETSVYPQLTGEPGKQPPIVYAEPPESTPSEFPVDSFKDAARHLRRPFTAEAVKWKVQVGTLVVPYIDARLVVERLNLVIPHKWSDDYEPLSAGAGLLCRLTVDGITRIDVGSGYVGKGLFSDALKRGAVKFGVGVSLYALPKVFLKIDEGQLRDTGKKDKHGKPLLEITDKGRERLDSGYRAWLKETGERAFGEPLDHGDVAEAVGDAEAESEVNAAQTALATEEPAAEKKLDTEVGKSLIATAESLYKALKPAPFPPAAFRRQLAGVWHDQKQLEAFIETLEHTEAAS